MKKTVPSSRTGRQLAKQGDTQNDGSLRIPFNIVIPERKDIVVHMTVIENPDPQEIDLNFVVRSSSPDDYA